MLLRVLLLCLCSGYCLGQPDTLREEQQWAEPINLGSPIGSKNDDYAPIIKSDSKILYFTTRGKEGVWRKIDSTLIYGSMLFKLDTHRVIIPVLALGDFVMKFNAYPIHWEDDCLFYYNGNGYSYLATWHGDRFVAYPNMEHPVYYNRQSPSQVTDYEQGIFSPEKPDIIYSGSRAPELLDDYGCSSENRKLYYRDIYEVKD